ncbi:MAG: ribbon-helix-helix domain-containing protein [Actinomycetota bacterium]|nr:ribbon-helix-helix domain-containing protein [Actinomycetota bacterium]
MADSAPKRVTVTLGESDVERLDEISREGRVSKNDAIRRALATEAFVQRTLAAGRKILIEDADGKIREVEFVK